MNRIFTIAILIFYAYFQVSAQERPSHPKKIFVSPDHKIFYNKALPVYFFVATSSDPNAPHYLLTSEKTPKYANPMFFDTEGENTLRSPSAVDTITKVTVIPKIDVQFEVYVDSKPPSTEIVFDKSKEKVIKGVHYLPDSATVSFKVTDAMSGPENTYISIDSNAYQAAASTLPLDKEKEYVIKYYSVDNTGNVERLREIKFHVDKTPPISTLTVDGPKYEDILAGESTLTIHAEDNVSGVKHIYISIDDSTIFRPYKGKINAALLVQGDHKLYYYATDEVNNKEKLNSYAFYVDKTPPQVIEEVMGKTFNANGKEFSAGTSKLKITSFDNKAGVKEIFYSINNAPYIKYEKPIVLAGHKGDMIVKSYAVDNVGNKSQSDISDSRKNGIPYIDLSAPWVGHSFKGPNFVNRDTLFINHKTNIILEAKDSESGVDRIEYQTDSSDLLRYKSPFTFRKEGYHRVSIYGYDNTENLTRQEFGVYVDTTGPQIFERFSSPPTGTIESEGEKLNQYPRHIVIFLSATDDNSGFETILFQLNNAPMQSYMRDIRDFIPDKKNILKVKAIDKLGNQTLKIIEFYIK
jgi:hypothetical protein